MPKKQTWNSRSKHFVLVEYGTGSGKKGGIKDMKKTPFEGVKIVGEYPDRFKDLEDEAPDPVQESQPQESQESQESQPQETKKKKRAGLLSFFTG